MGKKISSETHALNCLLKAGCSQNVIKHSKAVANLATKIAQKIASNGGSVDVDLVTIGALLHDLGRAETHSIEHAIIGATIARSLHFPQSLVQIIERHIGSGITAKEAERLRLPKKDFVPISIEEKIVTYSDKLIEGGKEIGFTRALKLFSRELGGFLGDPAIERFKKIHYEISSMTGGFNQVTKFRIPPRTKEYGEI